MHQVRLLAAMLAVQASICSVPLPAHADESGSSAWAPGQFGSFAAVPADPGFALETLYYHRHATATGGRIFEVGGRTSVGLSLTEQYIFLTPSYTFAEPVLHGQLSLAATFAPGRMDASV